MLNFAQMLAQNVPPAKPTKHKRNTDAAHKAVRDDAVRRYREAMGTEPITAPQIAAKLGIVAQSALLQMYEFEKRGDVTRTGKVMTPKRPNPPILWKWIGGGHE